MTIRIAFVLLVAAALAGTASAQPMAGGQGGMPDPRQMSGMPRGEQNDPAGQLTVKLVQGSIGAPAPEGTPVSLVAVGADGSVDQQVVAVDAGGRAVFTRLDTAGRKVYYAMTVLRRGDVEDRLRSQMIAMPPQVGVRLVLAGLAATSTEPGVDDLAVQGLPSIGAGEVVVDVRGAVRSIAEIRVIEVGNPAIGGKAAPQPIDQAVVARIGGLPTSGDKVFIAETAVDGRVYRSPPFQLTPTRGAFASIFAYPNLLSSFHAGAELDDDKLWFQVQFTMFNGAGAPYDPGPDGLVIPLPDGFIGASVREQDAPRIKVDKDVGFVWRGAMPPGQRSFVGTFAVPADSGRAAISMPLPYGAIDSQISFHALPGMQVRSRQGSPPRFRELDGGAKFTVLSELNIQAGDRLDVAVEGLPQPAGWLGLAEAAVGAFALAMIGLGILGVFVVRGRAPGSAVGDGELQRLILERERLYERLVSLEKQRRGGRVPEERFARERAALTDELAQVIRAIRAADPAVAARG